MLISSGFATLGVSSRGAHGSEKRMGCRRLGSWWLADTAR
jgi:hypothetical protein